MTGSARPVALVTGASSGIGTELARAFARGGHDLVLVARRQAALATLAHELTPLGARSRIVAQDLTLPDSTDRVLATLKDGGDAPIDVLVANAGFGDAQPFAAAEPGKLDRMVSLNVGSLTSLTRALLPGMVTRGRGRILLVASTAAFQPGPGMALYCATKAFVLSLGEALSEELRATGVTLTVLCPGTTRTEFFAVAGAERRAFARPATAMSAARVAELGFRAAMAGRRVAVPGLHNKLVAATTRFVPRWLLLPAVRRVLSGG